MTVSQLLSKTKALLKENQIENYENEAAFLLEKATGSNRTQLLLKYNEAVSRKIETALFSMTEKRISGVPLQYLLGEWDFLGEPFYVGEGVLVPRPETEELCEYVIDRIKEADNPSVIDLCAGTGCIGISIKKRVPQSLVRLVEKSKDAFDYLSRNAERHVKNQFIILTNGDVLHPELFKDTITEQVDVIVSNPPYIKTAEIENLQKEVLQEPKMALDGGEDGYDFYRVICREWPVYLKNGGFIALECGENQAQYITELFDKELFETEIVKDFASIDRFVIGRKKFK